MKRKPFPSEVRRRIVKLIRRRLKSRRPKEESRNDH